MSPPISSLMQRDVVSANLDDAIEVVEARMTRHRLSWLPVLESGSTVLGVISAADLLRFHADGRDPAAVHAWQLCTYKPIMVAPDATVAEVARLMIERAIHHVVVAEGTSIVGVVSSLDFVRTHVPGT